MPLRASLDGEAGFALLVVILFLLATTAVVAPFVLAARTSLDIASDTLRKDRLDLLAEGLAAVLARNLAAPPEADVPVPASLRSLPARCRTDTLALEARIQDQRGLVDLNQADEALLATGFRTLGLAASAASGHARAVMAYRQPEEDDGDDMTALAADESLVADGFKRAPFEAVEEAYDFVALQGVPLQALVETFTVHSRQPEIAGDRMPARLAAVLPERPSPRFPFVAEAAAGPVAYRIEVFLRSADATLGYAGVLAAESDSGPGGLAVVERVSNPGLVQGPASTPAASTTCEALFGGEAAASLRGFPD